MASGAISFGKKSAFNGAVLLEDYIKRNTVSCTIDGSESRVVSQSFMDTVADKMNIESYLLDTDMADWTARYRTELEGQLLNHAKRLFVLVAAGGYSGQFLYHMVCTWGYKCPEDIEAPIVKESTIVGKGKEHMRDKLLKDQALVCAPKITSGRYDYNIMCGALPFSKAAENPARISLYDSVENGAKKAWDVVLGKDFQDGDLGTTDFALTQHSICPEDKKNSVAGFVYERHYYCLWKTGGN